MELTAKKIGWVNDSRNGGQALTVEYSDGTWGWPVRVSHRISPEAMDRIADIVMEDLNREG